MTTAIPRIFNFRQGANTSSLDNTPAFPVWPVFDDARVDQDAARRRLGKTGVMAFTPPSNLIVFDGSTNYLLPGVDSRVATLGTKWTVETLFKTTSLSADRYVLGQAAHGALRIKHTSGGSVVVVFEDSAASVTTLTFTGVTVNTVCALQVKRDGATLTATLNGTATSGTVSSTLTSDTTTTWIIGADKAGGSYAGFFLGTIDFVRVLSTVESDQRHGWIRLPNPRASNVLLDVIGRADAYATASAFILDRGPYEFHATKAGSLTSTGAPLAYNAAPILGLGFHRDGTNQNQMYAVVGQLLYPVGLS